MTVDGCPFDIAGADCFVVLCVCAPRNAREDPYIRFVEKVTVKRTKSAHFVLSTGILPFKSTNTGVSVLSEFAPPERTCSFALS